MSMDDAFRQTDYCVQMEDEWFALRIGSATPGRLAGWLRRHIGCGSAWLVTACNPHAVQDSEYANQARRAVLNTLCDRPYLYRLPSVHSAPAGDWPDEHGWLLAGIEQGMAMSLARRFGQKAIVSVAADAPVRLHWCDDADA